MSVPLTPSADKNWITARCACLEESMARSLTVISLLFQSTAHCRYRVYTKFLLTYAAMYRRNRKVLPLGITALQPQSHFHLGTPYSFLSKQLFTMVHYTMYCLSWSCRSVQDSVCSWIGWSILGDDLTSRDWVKKSNNPYILWHDAVWVLLFTCVKWKLWWHQTKHCKYQSTLLRGMES